MGLYSIARYQIDTYGKAPRLAFSVAPFTAVAVPGVGDQEYSTVQLNWTTPQGDFSKVRLLRSQDGFPETEEDGLLLWSIDGAGVLLSSFVDSPSTATIPLAPGKFAYYRIWLYRDSTQTWLVAGDAACLVPRPHDSVTPDGEVLLSTHDKFMDLLPRVFTSANQSPLDVVDKTSTLYKFLKGFSYTLDEIMTFADNVLPEESGTAINPALIDLRTANLGLENEAYISTKSQKRLIREAIYMYTNKGTENALETYAESLTDFAPVVSSSPNLLLSVQDSSFYKGLGNWTVAGDGVLSVEQTVVPVGEAITPYAIDFAYTGKLVANSAGVAIRNGMITPKLLGIPTKAGESYKLSAKVQSTTTDNSVSAKIHLYNYLGNKVSEVVGASTPIPFGSWGDVSVTATAPGAVIDVSAYEVVNNRVILTVASTTDFTVGDTITVEALALEVDGNHTLIEKTGTTLQYNLLDNIAQGLSLNVPLTPVTSGTVRNTLLEGYAAVELIVENAGTVYFDMVQFADSSVTDYYEARAVDVFLNPKKTNEILNPSFDETNQTYWNITATNATFANNVLTLSTTANGPTSISADTGIVEGGKYYTYSVYARMAGIPIVSAELTNNVATVVADRALPWQIGDIINIHDFAGIDLFSPYNGEWEIVDVIGDTLTLTIPYVDQPLTTASPDARVCRPETLTMRLNSYNASITDPEDRVSDVHESAPYTFNTDWQRYTVTGFVASAADPIFLQTSIYGETNGCIMQFREAQLEASYLPTDYFDGEPKLGQPDSARNTVWEATPFASRSHLYPNRTIKTLRLAETLRSWLPINRAYTVRTYAGIEHKVI